MTRAKTSLFIFRRDLRVHDNTALLYALEHSQVVIPCFIFTPEQIEHNPYRSDHCLQVMLESLRDLEEQLAQLSGRLHLFVGEPKEIVERCIRTLPIESVVVNRDYTPYSIARDAQMERVCRDHQVTFLQFDDALLNPPEAVVKADGRPYSVFTPYHCNASQLDVARPKENKHRNYFREPIAFAVNVSIYQSILPKSSTALAVKGGRTAALALLARLQQLSSYSTLRDYPSSDHTSHLSAHLKFTTCSVREVYYALIASFGEGSDLIRSLYWRDFFTMVAFFWPHVFSGAFHAKYDQLKWSTDTGAFQRWCQGLTGFPIVDAGMREMNTTGFMHNRVRMVVASFLTKDLRISWRWGEKYFAQKLLDYDPCVNNGNWQWSASTGCDAQPYFRIFNPWLQQARFDPDGLYIKRWVPELRQLPAKAIHGLKTEGGLAPLDYPAPMVDHRVESKVTVVLYKAVR